MRTTRRGLPAGVASARNVLRALAVSVVAAAVVVGGLAPPASADVPLSCPSGDRRTAFDRVPQPTVLVASDYWGTFSGTGERSVEPRRPIGVSELGRVHWVDFALDNRLWDRTSVWVNSTGCFGGYTGRNVWVVDRAGQVAAINQSYKDGPPTRFFGDLTGARLNAPIVGMAVTPTGGGYWLLGRDGGIFTFGDARFYGSTGNLRLNSPIIGMTPTRSGKGYWLFAADGGIFTFGDARFYGSTGSLRLNKPVVGMSASPSGRGYRLVASDGGIFTFGDATFLGSTGSYRLSAPIVGMLTRPLGYSLVGLDGKVYSY